MVDHSFGNVPKFATKHDLNLSMPFQFRTVSLVGNFGHRSASSSLSSSGKTDSGYNHHQSVGGDDEVDNNREVAMLSVQVRKLQSPIHAHSHGWSKGDCGEILFLEYFIGLRHIFQRARREGSSGKMGKVAYVAAITLFSPRGIHYLSSLYPSCRCTRP